MIFNLSGGGGTSLNVKIVDGTSEPTASAGNVIWVDTDTKVTSWAMCPTQPSDPVEGMLWLPTDNTGKVSFNILKKNAVIVSLTGCRQYVDGAWVRKAACYYQDGVKTQFATLSIYLYEYGNEHTDSTGEWIQKGAAFASLERNSDKIFIAFNKTAGQRGYFCKNKQFDLSDIERVIFEGHSGYDKVDLYVGTNVNSDCTGTPTIVKSIEILDDITECEIDVTDLSGNHEIGFTHSRGSEAGAARGELTIQALRLE